MDRKINQPVLPCPFCGSKAEIITDEYQINKIVKCINKGCKAQIEDSHRPHDTDIYCAEWRWNKRIADYSTLIPKAHVLERLGMLVKIANRYINHDNGDMVEIMEKFVEKFKKELS